MIMRLRNVVFGVVASAAVAGAALAQDADAIANRLDVMKVTIAGAVRPAAMMTMGKQDYDAAAAKAAMQTIATAMATFPSLFPPGSENIKDRAGPAIWSDPAGFKAASDKLVADATAAAAAADQGLDAFKVAFAKVGENCQGCHEKFRAPEE
jgi:cytochrome c556